MGQPGQITPGNSNVGSTPTTKVEAFLQKQLATNQMQSGSARHGQRQEGSKIITSSKYVEIKLEKPDTPDKARWPPSFQQGVRVERTSHPKTNLMGAPGGKEAA